MWSGGPQGVETVMSTAMRSTLQTVPESLEVTRGGTDNATTVAKTPAKISSEATTTTIKQRAAFNYHTSSATNKVRSFKHAYLVNTASNGILIEAHFVRIWTLAVLIIPKLAGTNYGWALGESSNWQLSCILWCIAGFIHAGKWQYEF